MFLNDTVVSVINFVYKLLVEIASNQIGYTISTKPIAKTGLEGRKVVNNMGDDARACRFVYQTLRVIPISTLYYETNTPMGGSDKDILGAVAKLYSSETRSIQSIFADYGLRVDNTIDWGFENSAVNILESGLMAVVLDKAERLVPCIFNGEPVLKMYAKLPQMRVGLWNRYKKSYKHLVQDNPGLLEVLEQDWFDWAGRVHIDADRADAYVAESILGTYMGRFFFTQWNKERLQELQRTRQRVIYEGSALDLSARESIAIREDPHIDFHQAMTDILDLSNYMFFHSTASRKNKDNLLLQYSVLEWYTKKTFNEVLKTLNGLYRDLQNGKTDWSQESIQKASEAKSHDILRLSTELGVSRQETIDNTMKERIRRNIAWLDEMYEKYGEIDISNITEEINRYMLQHSLQVGRDKQDSDYPFFKDKEDVIVYSDSDRFPKVAELIGAMNVGADGTRLGEDPRQFNELLASHRYYVVSDSGYQKMALLLRTLKALDDLNIYLRNHDMSIADLDSVNYLDNTYYAMTDDLEGVLYSRMNRAWVQEHSISDSNWKDLYDDGIQTSSASYLSNVEVRRTLAARSKQTEVERVDLSKLSDLKVVDRPQVRSEFEVIPLLKETKPVDYELEKELNGCLATLCMRFWGDYWKHDQAIKDTTKSYVTKFPIYSPSKNYSSYIWEQVTTFMENFNKYDLAVMLGDFIHLMYLEKKLFGQGSPRYQTLLSTLEAISSDLRINLVRALDTLEAQIPTLGYLSAGAQFGARFLKGYVDEGKNQGPLFSFVFENLVIDLNSGKCTYGGSVIGNPEMKSVIERIKLRYSTAAGFDTEIVNKEHQLVQSRKVPTISLTHLSVLYFTTVNALIDAYLSKFLPVGIAQCKSSNICEYWAKRDQVFARQGALVLIGRIYEDYITKINRILGAYNDVLKNNLKFKTYASLALSKGMGIAQSLKQFSLSLLKLHQDLKAGVPQDELLAEMDKLQINYVQNIKANNFMDLDYCSMLHNIVLTDACEWIQNIQVPTEINQICDSIMQVRRVLRKDLSLDITQAKRYETRDYQKYYDSCLDYAVTKAREDKESMTQLMSLTIAAGNHRGIEKQLSRITGMPSSMRLQGRSGFLKNPEGRYYNASVSETELAFLRYDGVVCICDVDVDNSTVGGRAAKFVLLSELSDDLEWNGAEK